MCLLAHYVQAGITGELWVSPHLHYFCLVG